MIKLSVIIPCYNCEKTLPDAVDSVFRQDPVVPFDVTMVDDGSTDRTYEVMRSLAAGKGNIRIVRHELNLGGGAARNTAVANSDGDIIFCLDSDDILGPDFLRNMTRFWMEKQCDGLGISTSVKFRKSRITDVAYVTEFQGPGQKVSFDWVLDDGACSLYSTFLITRRAFHAIGGYPVDHGFDTQGMAVRFLCNGLTAYTCPSTVYFHRVAFHRSYYMREERAGRNHWNMFRIFSEFLYLFRRDIRAKILEYEVFPTRAQPLLSNQLRQQHQVQSVFRPDHAKLVRAGRDGSAQILLGSTDKYDQYWLGTYFLSKLQFKEAMDHFVTALDRGFNHRIVYCQLLEAGMRLSGNELPAAITIRDIVYNVNNPVRSVESANPPLRRYQQFENWLLSQWLTRVVGRVLRAGRLGFRAIFPTSRVG